MGGLSEGFFRMTDDDTLIFKGDISLENRGGFSMVRNTFDSFENMSAYTDLVFTITSDENEYNMQFYNNDWFENYYNQKVPKTKAGVETVVRMPLSGFVKKWRGMRMPGWFEKDEITGFSFYTAKKEGEFR